MSTIFTSSTIPVAANEYIAAYRPITITGTAPNSPICQVCFCDVYFNGGYYKTIESTVPATDPAGGTVTFDIDIQNAAQEWLKFQLIAAGTDIFSEQAAPYITSSVYCKLRAGTIDPTTGILNIEGTIPVQGTKWTSPTAGGGLQTSTFYVINAVLQQQNYPDFTTSANYYRGYMDDAIFPAPTLNNTAKINGLWHSKQITVSIEDYGQMLFLCRHNGFVGGGNNGACKAKINLIDQSGTYSSVVIDNYGGLYTLQGNKTYTLPTAPKSIDSVMTLHSITNIDWNTIMKYQVCIIQSYNGTDYCICKSPLFTVQGRSDRRMVIQYANGMGAFEHATFYGQNSSEMHVKSERVEFNLSNSFSVADKYRYGQSRTQPTSEDVFETTIVLNQWQLASYREILAAPVAFVQWVQDTVFNAGFMIAGQNYFYEGWTAQDYLSITILDGTEPTLKPSDRFQYEAKLKWTFAQRNIHQLPNL